MNMENTAQQYSDTLARQAESQRVLIFPALTVPVFDKQVYFLYSVKQLEDILLLSDITPVPYAPEYVLGITDWRSKVLPVLSMERCLGLETVETADSTRLMVIKSGDATTKAAKETFGMLKVSRQIQMVNLPIQCTPASKDWIPNSHLVRGVYESERGYLVVIKLQLILDGKVENGD